MGSTLERFACHPLLAIGSGVSQLALILDLERKHLCLALPSFRFSYIWDVAQASQQVRYCLLFTVVALMACYLCQGAAAHRSPVIGS